MSSAKGSEKQALNTNVDEVRNDSQNLFMMDVRRAVVPPRLIAAFDW